MPAPVVQAYSNITLPRGGGGPQLPPPLATVNVYLPPGVATQLSTKKWNGLDPTLPPYYTSSRFEGGSMIGPVLVRGNKVGSGGYVRQHEHEPWHIHKNCWRFPGCYNDLDIDHDKVKVAEEGFVGPTGAMHGGTGSAAAAASAADAGGLDVIEDDDFFSSQNGEDKAGDLDDAGSSSSSSDRRPSPSELPLPPLGKSKDKQKEKLHVHAHDHHGGHHPPYYYHRGYPPDYAFLEDKTSGSGSKPGGPTETHYAYGNDLWRIPHDPNWAESGIGLASEFGFGDDGSNCVPTSKKPCGWIADPPTRSPGGKIVNGVLGYDEAEIGQPFLKIGVGKLIKGSCSDCDPTDTSPGGYKFNSQYEFYEPPIWTVVRSRSNEIVLEHESTLAQQGGGKAVVGYRLRKTISLSGPTLTVTSSLTNLGTDPFATPWYSHHFFTCDGLGVGPAGAYGVDLELKPDSTNDDGTPVYAESGVGIWSEPLADYADVVVNRRYRDTSWFDVLTPSWWRTKGRQSRRTTQVTMTREVEVGTRIKAEFPDDGKTGGAFVLHGCGTSVSETIPELDERYRPVHLGSGSASLSLFAFNLYVERGTMSPEPIVLVELDGGATAEWTQRLDFEMDDGEDGGDGAALRQRNAVLGAAAAEGGGGGFSVLGGTRKMVLGPATLKDVFLVATVSALLALVLNRSRAKRRSYEPI